MVTEICAGVTRDRAAVCMGEALGQLLKCLSRPARGSVFGCRWWLVFSVVLRRFVLC